MQIIETDFLNAKQKESVCQLWNAEYPQKLAYDTIAQFDAYLDNLTDTKHYLLANDVCILGWAIAFSREAERWFAILLDSSLQKKGYGTLLLDKLKEYERALNGWVIDHDRDVKQNGELYTSPLVFYQKNGFTVCPEIRFEIEVLSAVKITWQR